MAKRKYISARSSRHDQPAAEKKSKVSATIINSNRELIASIGRALGPTLPCVYRWQWKRVRKAGHYNVLKAMKLRNRKRKCTINLSIGDLKAALSWASKESYPECSAVLVLAIVEYLNKFEGIVGISDDGDCLLDDDALINLLCWAASCGHEDLARALLNLEEFPEIVASRAPDKWRYPRRLPLHLAAEQGHLSVVRVMLNHHKFREINTIERIYSATRGHWTPAPVYYPLSHMYGTALHQASMNGHVGVVIALLNHKDFDTADVHDHDFGCTALHLAAWHNRVEVVRALLDHEKFTAVNDRDNTGYTALDVALHNGSVRVVRVLLRHPKLSELPCQNALHVVVEGHFLDVRCRPTFLQSKAAEILDLLLSDSHLYGLTLVLNEMGQTAEMAAAHSAPELLHIFQRCRRSMLRKLCCSESTSGEFTKLPLDIIECILELV